MASILKPKKSTTAGAVPTTASLADGEMAVNTADRRIFVRVGAAIVDLFNRVFNPFNQGNGFISWTGEATVTSSTSVALLDSTGVALSPTKTYKVAACNIDSSAQRGAVALFVGDGSAFTLKTVYEQGTTSSNVQLYLNAGVPSVSVYGGSGPYRIPYRIEEVPNFGQGLSEFGILQRPTDAPSDGKTYGRKDAMWVEAGGGGKTLKQQVFTSSGTWTRPAGVNSVEVLLVGGGGGGGGGNGNPTGAGGGGQVIRRVVAVTGNVTVTIGSGGTAGTPSVPDGGQGGTTTFGSISAYGGGGGGGTGAAPTVVNGGSGGGGAVGGRSASGVGEGAAGGSAQHGGGAGGAAAADSFPGPGLYGFGGGGGGGWGTAGSNGGGRVDTAGNGIAGQANTGGGGGGSVGNTKSGGAGGSGICIVTWWE